MTQGKKLKKAIGDNAPLLVVGTVNAYSSLLAEKKGHKAIYLSGGGVAASSLGIPDLGITTLQDVLTDVERITNVCELPLLVDADTGWGGALNISRMVKSMITSRAAGIHIEDQEEQKRCGHRPNKKLVSSKEMQDRLKAAVDARNDPDFMIMARTDALANEGLDMALERVTSYEEAGADAIMIHSRKKSPKEIFEFCEKFNSFKSNAPLMVVPSSFNSVKEEEWEKRGVQIVCYANHMLRSAYPSMLEVARSILMHGRSKESDNNCMPIKEILELIPGTK